MAILDPHHVLALTAVAALAGALLLRPRRGRRGTRVEPAAEPGPATPDDQERWPRKALAARDGGLLGLRATPDADAALLEAARQHLVHALPAATIHADGASCRLLLEVDGDDAALKAAADALQAQLPALGALAWRMAGASGVFAAATPWPKGESAQRASARLDGGLREAIARGAPRVFLQPLRRGAEQAVMLAPRYRPITDRHGRGIALVVVEMPLPAGVEAPGGDALDALLAGVLAAATVGRRPGGARLPVVLPADRASGAPADWGDRLVELIGRLAPAERGGLGVLVQAVEAARLAPATRQALASLASNGLLLALAMPPEGGGEDVLLPAEPGLVAFDMREWSGFERDPLVQAALRVQVARARRRGRACIATGEGSTLQRLGLELAGVTLQADADSVGALDGLDAPRVPGRAGSPP